MSRKHTPKGKDTRRESTDEFKREAVQMLMDGHSAKSLVERLGISGTNLLHRWKQQQLGQPDRWEAPSTPECAS